MNKRLSLKYINLCKNNSNQPCKECPKFKECVEFAKFFEKHSNTASYSHFDPRTNLKNPKTRKYVMTPEKVTHHGFFPFVNFTKKETKYVKDLPDHIKYKERELYYAAHLDRCIYQYYGFLLNQAYNKYSTEHELDDVAIAYRTNISKTNIHCAKEAFDFLDQQNNALIIINDLTKFFDKLDHKYLEKMMNLVLGTKELTPDMKAIHKNITGFSSLQWEDIVEGAGLSLQTPKLKTTLNQKEKILERHEFRKIQKKIVKNKNTYGIPQGSPISAVLANVYMAEFDVEMNELVKKYQGVYKRYSDDTIVIVPLTNNNQEKAEKIRKEFIWKYNYLIKKYDGLITIQPDKTETAVMTDKQILRLNDNAKHLDYLGFRYKDGKVYMMPRSITRYFYRLKRMAKRIFNNCYSKKPISYKDIYKRFSDCNHNDDSFGNFITYAKKANRIIGLEHDHQLQRIIKYNKMYVRTYINKYATIIRKETA